MATRGGMTAAELDEMLTWSIVRMARLVGQRLADRLVPLGLNPIQFGVLAHLAIDTDVTQADLARSVLVRPQSIAPLLDGLEARGLIARTGDRTRGRRNPVRLTEHGREALDAARPVALSANDLTDAGLTSEDAAELNRLLQKAIQATGGARPGRSDQLWSA